MTIAGTRKDILGWGSALALLVVQLAGIAFACGVVWQKMDHVEAEMAELKTFVAGHADDRVNLARALEGLDSLRRRVDQIERHRGIGS